MTEKRFFVPDVLLAHLPAVEKKPPRDCTFKKNCDFRLFLTFPPAEPPQGQCSRRGCEFFDG